MAVQPKSPEYSPPEPPTALNTIADTLNSLNPFATTKGGGVKGGTVYYRGSTDLGLPPNHIWDVKRMGDQFITIQTDAVPNDNNILVVNPTDVLSTSDIAPDSEFFRDYAPVEYPTSTPNHSYMSPQTPSMANGPAPIQFSPMIKIVNGDDNSKNIDNPNANTGLDEYATFGGNSDPIIVNNPTHSVSKTEGGETSQQEKSGKKQNGGNEGGMFSGDGFFSNIKKLL
jgi:hypothetical protein